jgi:hypothetical protein
MTCDTEASNDYADEQNIGCIAFWYSFYKICIVPGDLLTQCNALVLLWTHKKLSHLALVMALFPLMSTNR